MRQPVPAGEGPGSAWFITFGASERVPVESLSFEVREDELARPFRLELADPGEPRQYLAGGEWRRRPEEPRKPLVIAFPEAMPRRLRLVVTDFRNPPLNITAARYTAAARQVIFRPPDDAEGSLRLYFGNPRAQEPRYDFASTLPATLDPAPLRTDLGVRQANPDYRPPAKPWTERWPWLVYVVLGVASVVLLVLLGLLGREAMARHDAAETAASSG
jgi:hypothetical protein